MSIGYRTRCESLLRKSLNKMDSHHQVWARWEAGSAPCDSLRSEPAQSKPGRTGGRWARPEHLPFVCLKSTVRPSSSKARAREKHRVNSFFKYCSGSFTSLHDHSHASKISPLGNRTNLLTFLPAALSLLRAPPHRAVCKPGI